jgi:23S rRNA (guanosine2251-2'-O)-methyltransferase
MEKRADGFLINKGEQDKDFIFGTRAVMEAILAHKEIDKILIDKEVNNELVKELLKLAKDEKNPCSPCP